MNAPLIRKELRENGKWAALGALVLLIGMSIALLDGGRMYSIVNEKFQLTTQIGFAALAVVLAAAATLPEQWRDRWAFVTHRPATRTRLLAGKACVGVALLVLACGVPLMLVAAWAMSPARATGPVPAEMLQPAISDVAGAIAWYFAAVLVCVRRARWHGSRVLPLGVPLVASMLVAFAAQSLAQALAIHGAALLVLLPAAWGAYIAGGTYEPQPRVAKATQYVAVGVGMCVFTFVAATMAAVALQWCAHSGRWEDWFNQYLLRRDGRIVRAGHNSANGFYDLAGNRIPELTPPALEVATEDFWKPFVFPAPIAVPPAEDATSFRAPDRYVRMLAWEGPAQWFFLRSRNTIEGYSIRGGYVGGYGPDGFVAAPARPKPFPSPLHPPGKNQYHVRPVIADRQAAYRIDLRGHAVQRIYTAPAGEWISGVAADGLWHTDDERMNKAVFIATPKRVHFIPPSTTDTKPFDIPIEPMYEQPPALHAAYLWEELKVVLWNQGDWRDPGSGVRSPQRVVEYDLAGNLLRRTDLPPLASLPALPGLDLNGGRQRVRLAMLPMYAALSVAEMGVMKAASRAGAAPPDANLPLTRETLALMSGVAALCAAAGYLLARRHAFSVGRRLAWAAGGLVFALPGALTMLSVRSMPAQVRCPSCGRRRIVTRERCEHCDAPFTPPAKDGTEIFE